MIRRVFVLLALLAATTSTPAQASGLYVSCYQTSSSLNYASYRCLTSDGYAP